jgi:lipid-A-disaccharide synthase
MRAAGCQSWAGTEEISVMGLAEVVRHLPRLAALKRRITAQLLACRPAVFVGIDAPDFNLRVAADLRAGGIRTVQYVCPSVWAWRRGRVKTLRRACDRVLCLLPFEVPFLEGAGVAATFVGHPFADEIEFDPDAAQARARLGIEAGLVVGLLPGSRASEVTRLGPVFLQAAQRLQRAWPELGFVAPLVSAPLRRLFEAQLAEFAPDIRIRLLDGRAREAMAASDVVLAASGTVTLEAMLSGRPMVVAYRVAALTYRLARGLDLVKVRYCALPNLLADAALVPEYLQNEATEGHLADAVLNLLRSSDECARLRARFAELGTVLRRGASETSALAALELAGLR